MHQEGSMEKSTLFLFGILVVLVGLFEATSQNSLTDILKKKHRNIASFKTIQKTLTINDQLNGLMKLAPAKHVKVYHETFNIDKKASL